MTTPEMQKKVKIYFLNELQEWMEYSVATLHIQTKDYDKLNISLVLDQTLPHSKLTVLPLIQIYKEEIKTITIGLEMVSKVEKLDLVLAIKLEEWNRVLAFSFRDQQYCEMILEQIELQISSINQMPYQKDQILAYLSKQIEISLLKVDWLFGNENIIKQFTNYVKDGNLSIQNERNAFKITKNVFMRGSKSVLEMFLRDEYFLAILKCLSYNFEFGDRRIDYAEEYLKISKCRNILQLQEQHIIYNYSNIIKARFLIDYATAMFLEPNTHEALNQIIRQSTLNIIALLVQHSHFFKKYKKLACEDPILFVQLFSELWEMFKLIIVDFRDQKNIAEIKMKFHKIFVDENLLEVTFECVLKLAEQNLGNSRLYQKFLQSLNPFLSYKWMDSQQLLINHAKNNKIHLCKILLSILKMGDENTNSIILLFAKNLIEATENRKLMKQSFLNYVFTEFIAKIEQYFKTTAELQILVDFYLKCYKIDILRSRRCIIQSKIIPKLQQKKQNKYALILLVRLIRFFLQSKDEGIFIYLNRHNYLSFLRQKYFEIKKYNPRGILFSMILGLLKDAYMTSNQEGIRFIQKTLLHQVPIVQT